jgi:hypothetical protein
MNKVSRTCECCKKPFLARAADVARGWARFCSKRCKAIKQEQRTGFHADFVERQARRDLDHDNASADQGWDAHKNW